MRALEAARSAKEINKSQEAAVVVAAPRSVLAVLEGFGGPLYEELFIVSGARFEEAEEVSARVEPAEGEKCPRCWNYRTLGGNASHPHVCERCGDVLDALGFDDAGAKA